MNSGILMKIGIFNFDFATIISFIVGIGTGFILLFLIYALAVLTSLKSKNFIAKTKADDLTTQEVKDIVLQTQKAFKDKTLRKDLSRVAHCSALSKDLAYGIAVRFYPKSHRPFLELSINEITLLTGYITSRVNDILNHRGIRMLRKLKISTIVNFSSKTKSVEESKVFQTTKKVSQTFNKVKGALDIINPLKWGKKLIIDRIINLIVDKICLVVISIVGEETYKIYSKKVFHEELEVDLGTEELVEEMSDSLKEAVLELDGNVESSTTKNIKKFKTKILIMNHSEERFTTINLQFPFKKKVEDKNK